MKFCTNCGKQLEDSVSFCPSCGTACAYPVSQQPVPVQPAPQKPAPAADDAPSFLMALIGFLVPIAGLILYIINRDTRPKEAASAGKGALASVICSAVLSVLYVIFVVALMVFGMYGF